MPLFNVNFELYYDCLDFNAIYIRCNLNHLLRSINPHLRRLAAAIQSIQFKTFICLIKIQKFSQSKTIWQRQSAWNSFFVCTLNDIKRNVHEDDCTIWQKIYTNNEQQYNIYKYTMWSSERNLDYKNK